MTAIFLDGALHPGRDPNDAAWLVLRRPEDWTGATLTGVVVDPAIPALVLAPAPAAGDLPLAGEVIGPDGTRYRSEPALDRVSWQRACDPSRVTLVGGRGTETGRLRRPLGLALDARRGLLAIADADNHRVQVVRADGGEPVVVLGCLDVWGRGVAPSGAHPDARALAEPVAVAFGGGYLAVADRAGGRVHVYDDRFRWLAAFAPVPAGANAGFVPHPVAVAVLAGRIWVIDAGWSVPVAYGLDGELVADAGAPPEALAPWVGLARFAARGEVVHGPIDGGIEDLDWHRVIVDARVPAGCAIEVQTFAADDPAPPAAIPWAPARPVPIPLAEVDPRDGEASRLVLSDHGRWQRKRGEPFHRATPVIARLLGTGPNAGTGFTMPWREARRLRRDDMIELVRLADGSTAPGTIANVAGRAVRATVHVADPTGLQVYAAGSELVLVERDGEAPVGGPRSIADVTGTDTIDLTAAADDGTLYDLPSSHGIAAFLRDGDVAVLRDGAITATIVVHSIDAADASIALVAPVTGDFSTSDLRLIVAPGRLLVGALDWTDGVPPAEPVIVHDDFASSQVDAAIRWAEHELGALWLVPGPVVPWATWTRFVLPEAASTDRGRYLWLRLHLLGATATPGAPVAYATPVIRAVRLLRPRLSYLRYLPAVYARRDADDPSGALFLERLLAVPERRLTDIEARFEDVARQLNPLASSPDWLTFLATWYGLVFDPSWPIERRRQLVVHAHDLFARRGTVHGLRRYLEIYTGTTPAIVEGFQWGVATGPTVLGGEVVLGRVGLGTGGDVAARGPAHHFAVWVFGDDGACGAGVTERAARAIIEAAKPAHTTYELHVVDGAPRVGVTSMVGVDMVLVGGEPPPPPLGLVPRPPHVLGRIHLPAPPRARAAATLGPLPIDEDFTLT